VTVRIGPPIESAGRTPEALNALAEEWIEAQQRLLDAQKIR
jgi:1-acyl-sn-glycerol-3-phosphate acyltransferase